MTRQIDDKQLEQANGGIGLIVVTPMQGPSVAPTEDEMLGTTHVDGEFNRCA